jgi:glyoxylase I family protein
MVITAMTPMLGVSDIGRSLAFYRDLLGFGVISTFEPGRQMSWAHLLNGPAELMLTGHPGAATSAEAVKAHGDARLYIWTDDVLEVLARARALGMQAAGPSVRFYGIKDFELTDPDGYGLVIGQETDEKPTPE